MVKIISDSPSRTREIARRIGEKLMPGDVLAFRGPMGAGKTTFIGGLALGLGITEPVSSPTFALVNEYSGGRHKLCHFDMYRISGPDDLESTGFYDYLDSGAILAVEWSENIAEALDENICVITMTALDENTREIIIEGDPRIEAAGG